ncbi:hypothetical protein JNB_00285 [Janibacter sp. HTCC2649]|nr:hypothetical protein JNB_00285 [Janibacter sp. HTCC2649]
MNPLFAWIVSLILTIFLLAAVGVGLIGWLLGLIFLPIIGAVVIMTVTS